MLYIKQPRVVNVADPHDALALKSVKAVVPVEVGLTLVNENPPGLLHNRRLKIYYATQAETNPPHFIFFVNDTSNIHFSKSYRFFQKCKILNC